MYTCRSSDMNDIFRIINVISDPMLVVPAAGSSEF